MSTPRPQLRAYWNGDDENRHQRHTNPPRQTAQAERPERPEPEPYFGVYVMSLLKDWSEGDYEYWDGDCLEYVTAFGRKTTAKFLRLEDAQAFAREAWGDRERLATMHNVKDAAVLVINDQDGKEYDCLPLLRIVPAVVKRGWFGWWWKLLGW